VKLVNASDGLGLLDFSEAKRRAVEELSFLTVWLPTGKIFCREIEKLVWGTMGASHPLDDLSALRHYPLLAYYIVHKAQKNHAPFILAFTEWLLDEAQEQ